MESVAPPSFAEPWDKVGLHVGRPLAELRPRILLTIDLTERVMREAEGLGEGGAGAIIAYHPPIWEPMTRLTDATPRQRVLLRAIERGMAIYSPHTALDATPQGLNDWLCEGLSGVTRPGERVLGDCRALRAHAAVVPEQAVKIVTFVPGPEVERVRAALATAGAGIIGHYSVCSFTSSGTGTFLGDEKSRPSVGQPGRLESVEEVRLEMVCSKAALALAVETLRQFHPYEEPAIDVYELIAKPTRGVGAGRRLVLDHPVSVEVLAQRLKKHLGREHVRVASRDMKANVKTIGVCAGAGGDLAAIAAAEGCEVFVTGEMRHHDVLAALERGQSVILGEHTSTERGYLPRLAARIEALLPGVRCSVAQTDQDPLHVV